MRYGALLALCVVLAGCGGPDGGGLKPAIARSALRETLARWVGADRLLVAEGGAGRTDAGP